MKTNVEVRQCSSKKSYLDNGKGNVISFSTIRFTQRWEKSLVPGPVPKQRPREISIPGINLLALEFYI